MMMHQLLRKRTRSMCGGQAVASDRDGGDSPSSPAPETTTSTRTRRPSRRAKFAFAAWPILVMLGLVVLMLETQGATARAARGSGGGSGVSSEVEERRRLSIMEQHRYLQRQWQLQQQQKKALQKMGASGQPTAKKGLSPSFEDLRNVMPFEPVEFSSANVSRAYRSSSKFDPRGMGHLYLVTNLFMDHIQREEPYPDGLVVVDGPGRIRLGDAATEWKTLVTHWVGVAAVSGVALALAILAPCVGLIFCFCRCAGKCGGSGSRHPYEKRRDPCRRLTFGVFLSLIATVILFGVVCAFVTNEYMEEGTQELTTSLRTGLSDTKLYLSNTKEEVNNLLITNFVELEIVLNKILEASGKIVKDKLAEVSKAIALQNLTSIVSGLGKIKEDLHDIKTVTKYLQGNSSQLNQGLQDVRMRLIEKLEKCTSSSCLEVLKQYDIEGLSVEADFKKLLDRYFPKLPNVTDSLKNVSDLIDNEIEEEVLKGKEAFDSIQLKIQSAVNESIPLIGSAIRKAGQEIREGAVNITKVIDTVNAYVSEYTVRPLQQGDGFIKEYSQYRYYLDMGMSVLLLVILLCIVLGLFYGFCGKRPDSVYGGDDCCNKGVGARFLMAGVYVIFIFSTILTVVMVVHFLIGVVFEKAVCEPLHQPTKSRIMALVDEAVPLGQIYPPPHANVDVNVSTVIRACHQNQSIYSVLALESVMNVSEVVDYKFRFGLMEKIEELQSQIRLDSKVIILTPEARRQLDNLAASPLSDIDFPTYSEILEEKITSIDLMKLSEILVRTADELPDSQQTIGHALRNEAIFLESTQQTLVGNMLNMVRQLRENATALRDDLRFNRTSLREAVRELMQEVEEAQQILASRGPEEVAQLAQTFVSEFTRHIDEYLAHVVTQTKTQVGKCWPMSQVYNATVVSVCDKILNPFNGFWASIGWCIILFIPTIVLSVLLSGLYRKSDPYQGPLVETVPEKKNHHRSYHETYENQTGYVPDYSGRYGRAGQGEGEQGHEIPLTSSCGGDSRYRDVAPKHWEYPNGSGPPRYHSPPTEYERPPPYYYPGPGVAMETLRCAFSNRRQPAHRRHEVMRHGMSTRGSMENGGRASGVQGNHGLGPSNPMVFTYHKLDSLETKLYRGVGVAGGVGSMGAMAVVPVSSWRRQRGRVKKP
ncbi:prominin-like protein isoform X3 [Ischnura elegans]|uniref:prominin-like protein isoform X3 n=1 Tax=Ischnura elegans TaxID=197161 RepID=UPI001ED87871|nr:prominin-like protein isoform X3 [Ischnura elegans]